MKYKSLTPKPEKTVHIPALTDGMNASLPENSLKKTEAAFLRNFIAHKGELKTRDGLCANLSGILDVSRFKGAQKINYRLTDTEIYTEGEYKRIALAEIDYDETVFIYCIYLLGANATVQSLGDIIFNRLSDEAFFKPQSIVLYSGKPQRGGGIFAMVALENVYNLGQTECRYFEIDEDYSEWNLVMNYYIPTVYINGIGNAYENSQLSETSALKPMELEPLNRLDGLFYSYFTSDGCSSSFRLPFSDIDNTTVNCRIYYNLNNYVDWSVNDRSASSSPNTLLGTEVVMNVDRKKGIVFFTAGNSDYPVPAMSMYNANNIKILAKKKLENALNTVATSKHSLVANGKIFLCGGKNKNEIYTADFENPLYFPMGADNCVGESSVEITALAFKEGRLLVFKENSLYSAKLKSGKTLNQTALLADNGAIFKTADTFTTELISADIEAPLNSVLLIGGNPIWFSKSKGIYTLQGDKSVKLSASVDEILKTEFSGEKTFSAVKENYFILLNGRNAIIMDYSSKVGGFYYWQFPEGTALLGAVTEGDRLSLLCREQGSKLSYTALLQGECDKILKSSDSGYEAIESSIQSELKTKSFKLSDFGKTSHINRFDLNIRLTDKCELRIGDSINFADFIIRPLKGGYPDKRLKLIADIYGVLELAITLKSKGVISFKGADIYFNEIS